MSKNWFPMREGHKSLTDEELEERLKEERRRFRMGNAKERIIARRIIQELELEKARRYELKWGLS